MTLKEFDRVVENLNTRKYIKQEKFKYIVMIVEGLSNMFEWHHTIIQTFL